MITVSPTAQDELKKTMQKNDAAMVRVSFTGFGWGGAKFNLALEKSVQENDNIFEVDGLTVVIDKDYSPFYKKLRIDWVDSRAVKGFKVYDTRSSGC